MEVGYSGERRRVKLILGVEVTGEYSFVCVVLLCGYVVWVERGFECRLKLLNNGLEIVVMMKIFFVGKNMNKINFIFKSKMIVFFVFVGY